jgi:hypothetical protein
MMPIFLAPLRVLSCTLMQGLDLDFDSGKVDDDRLDKRPGFALQALMRPREALSALLNRIQPGGVGH